MQNTEELFGEGLRGTRRRTCQIDPRLTKTEMRTARSLLLVGHGSAHDSASGAPVRAVAGRLRRTGRFGEVATAFLKEGPALRDVLESLTSTHVYVIPMFLADGYYAREVVPRALGLAQPTTRRFSRWIHYCRPVGSHPDMVSLVADRALGALMTRGVPPGVADLILAGHGTERSAMSAGTVRDAAGALQRENLFRAVRYGLLDEAPRIEDAVRAADSACVVVVPYFLAEGWHTRRTLPDRLAAAAAEAAQTGRTILRTAPIGTSRRLDAIVLDLVNAAEAVWMEKAHEARTMSANVMVRRCRGCRQPMAGLAVAAEGVRAVGS